MILKGLDNQTVTFELEYHDEEAITGFKSHEEPIYRSLHLEIREFKIEICILISDVENIIRWFESHLQNEPIESNVYALDNQLYFTLVKIHTDSKTIRITHDSTVSVPGMGAYSLSSGAKFEDFHKKSIVDCEMDQAELRRVATALKTELINSKKV